MEYLHFAMFSVLIDLGSGHQLMTANIEKKGNQMFCAS